MKEIAEPFELEQFLGRPWHRRTGLIGPALEHGGLEAAFQVDVHLCFRKCAQAIQAVILPVVLHVCSFELSELQNDRCGLGFSQ
jgi:hypothetical protein